MKKSFATLRAYLHEKPPAVTPHHLYIVVLVALLAVDILLTVWLTQLGPTAFAPTLKTIELNPHLAPIAGSVTAQILYKAPYALLMIAGATLIAAAADRLLWRDQRYTWLVGAGKLPWLAMICVYALPVAQGILGASARLGGPVAPPIVTAIIPVATTPLLWIASAIAAIICINEVWQIVIARVRAPAAEE